MFDIGWGEMFLIGVVALIVVGPKDLPALFRTVGNFTGKARAMARDFHRSMEQAANESGMSEVSKSIQAIDRNLNAATGSARKFAQSMTQLPEPASPPASDAPAPTTPAPATPAPTTPAAAPAPASDAAPERPEEAGRAPTA